MLVDDRQARLHADRAGMPMTGTLGILRWGRERGLLTATAPLLQQLRARGFWISDDVVRQVEREETGG